MSDHDHLLITLYHSGNMLSFEGMWSKTISQMITVTVHISNICSDLKKLAPYNEDKEAEWATDGSDREE